MKSVLENEFVKVEINHAGAELCSYIDKSDNCQHIWQADPKVWGRHAPVLFPIVGKVENNEYLVDGKTYSMGQHGFARDMVFDKLMEDENELILGLKSNEETVKKYPFQFLFIIRYKLKNKSLETSYEVFNPSNSDLLFSVGAHPGFTCPFTPEESFEDYNLIFSDIETKDRLLLSSDGLLSGEISPNYLNGTNIIPLKHKTFEEDALIFEGLSSKSITIKGKDKGLKVSFPGFPLMGIWTKPGAEAPYICIEPWYGVADQTGKGGELKNKKGIISLSPQERFQASYFIEVVKS